MGEKPNIAYYLAQEARSREASFGMMDDREDFQIDIDRAGAAITAKDSAAIIDAPMIPDAIIDADRLSMVQGQDYNVVAEAGRITDVA